MGTRRARTAGNDQRRLSVGDRRQLSRQSLKPYTRIETGSGAQHVAVLALGLELPGGPLGPVSQLV